MQQHRNTTVQHNATARDDLHGWLSIGLVVIAAALFAGPLHARNKTADPAAGNERVVKKNATKVTHQRSPSEESRSERDRRMYRECQGRPNAGACLGYTRKP